MGDGTMCDFCFTEAESLGTHGFENGKEMCQRCHDKMLNAEIASLRRANTVLDEKSKQDFNHIGDLHWKMEKLEAELKEARKVVEVAKRVKESWLLNWDCSSSPGHYDFHEQMEELDAALTDHHETGEK